MSGVPQAKEIMDTPFVKYIIPVVKESKVINRFTSRPFMSAMWSNLMKTSMPFAGIELCFGKKGYKIDSLQVLLGEADSKRICNLHKIPQTSPSDEYFLSHKPGLFKRHTMLAIDRSYEGYTKQMVRDTVNAVKRVSRKVKTQTIDFADKVIDSGGIVLCLGTPLTAPFVSTIKVFCIPEPNDDGAVFYPEVVSFSKEMGCSENLETLSDMYNGKIETRYMSFVVGRKGVKNQVSVELSPKYTLALSEKSKLVHTLIDFLKVKGIANETHDVEDGLGFHHVKLTFHKGKITPKLYYSIGYERIKQSPPKAFDSQSGRPLDIVKSQK